MPVAPYELTVEVMRRPGITGWHYIVLPPEVVDDIHARFEGSQRAFGALQVSVGIGSSEWTTSLYYDNDTKTYVLPVKADVRKYEGVAEGDSVTVRLAVKR